MASFLGAIISSEDNAQFVQYALQLVELLVVKLPDVYRVSFIREGVGLEIEALAAKEPKAVQDAKKAKDDPEGVVKTDATDAPVAGPSTLPSLRDLDLLPTRRSGAAGGSTDDGRYRLSAAMKQLLEAENLIDARMGDYWNVRKKSLAAAPDLNDSNIWRARVLVEKKLFDMAGDDSNEAKVVLDRLTALVAQLSKQAATEGDLYDALREMAGYFSSTGESLSSFELLRGGVIDGLLEFADIDGTVSSTQRRSMLYEIFAETAPASSASPMTVLVKRLHESLGRLESFNVESAFNGISDPVRPGGSSLMRTLRIKLVADAGQEDLPKHVNNLVVSIQAIAPLQALHDYLRHRVLDAATMSGAGAARLLAASGGGSAGAQAMMDALRTGRQPKGGPQAGTTAAGGSTSTGTASAPAPAPTPIPGLAVPTSASTPATPRPGAGRTSRRRSARLSAQNTGTEETGAATGETSTSTAALEPPAAGPGAGAPLSSSAPNASSFPTLPMDLDFDEDYSDEEFGEEEVFEEDMEEELARPQEKVVNMNVAPGKVTETSIDLS